MALLEGPDFHTVDVEVLLGGERLVVEGGAFGGGASVQLGIQPQTQLTTAEKSGRCQGRGNRTGSLDKKLSHNTRQWQNLHLLKPGEMHGSC